jgi:ketosteroid isomerase-like protein
MKTILILISTTIFLSSCVQQKKVDLQIEGEKLMQLSKDWSELVKTGDLELILEGWADDAIMMAPNMPPLKGKDAIKAYVEEGLKIPGYSIRWEPLEVHVSDCGDMAYMIERNEIIVNDTLGNPMASYNKTVTVWRKQADGSWNNVIDMWNADPNGEF